MFVAAVALSLGHWPFSTPLLEMNQFGDDWIVACEVIEQARNFRQEDGGAPSL